MRYSNRLLIADLQAAAAQSGTGTGQHCILFDPWDRTIFIRVDLWCDAGWADQWWHAAFSSAAANLQASLVWVLLLFYWLKGYILTDCRAWRHQWLTPAQTTRLTLTHLQTLMTGAGHTAAVNVDAPT